MWEPCPDVLEIERVDFVTVPTRELETPNVTLGLWRPEAEGLPFSPNTAGIALRVPDVEQAREHLVAAGFEFLGETVDTGVCHMGFFYDPTATC
jgi:hypothetical protein